jgi:RimJ/RimL family protein N-acetyltransferase
MESLKLLEAKESDIPEIAALAELIWNQHYPSIISQTQIDYMLNWMYSTDSLKEQMQIKNHLFHLIEKNEEKIGFVSVNKENEKDWFLNKFYIDQNKSAQGIGSKAFDLLIETIHPKKITLTVNRQNFKSINFYFKKGFVIERVADFDIGNGYVMDDFVMVWDAIHH